MGLFSEIGDAFFGGAEKKAADEELHRVASIPEAEAIIMLIGIGFLPEKLRVAHSNRKQIHEILDWNRDHGNLTSN